MSCFGKKRKFPLCCHCEVWESRISRKFKINFLSLFPVIARFGKAEAIRYNLLNHYKFKERLSDWIASLCPQWRGRGTDWTTLLRSQWRGREIGRILRSSPKMTKKKMSSWTCFRISLFYLSAYLCLQNIRDAETSSAWQFDVGGQFDMGSVWQEEEMLKQVQHDSLVCVDSLV